MAEADRIPRVLVVDDEPNIRELVQVALKFHGCTVSTAANGSEAIRQAETTTPDLIVLDVMLPDIDGFEVCRRLRAAGNEVPVIFLTARDTSSDTVTGLAIGGDDYVTKPFSVEALVARVRAVLRRASRAAQPGRYADQDDILRAGDLELDESRWTVHRAGTPVELSKTEFQLLAYLMRHQGRVRRRLQPEAPRTCRRAPRSSGQADLAAGARLGTGRTEARPARAWRTGTRIRRGFA